MTKKTIKASDVLGDNYYIYELTSSNYTPALNDTITITCICKDIYGDNVANKSLTLYQNGTSKGTQTTNSSGVATWSITCSTAGLQKFNIKDTSIEVFVDNKEDKTNKVTSWSQTPSNDNYPSEKLTKDSLDNVLENFRTKTITSTFPIIRTQEYEDNGVTHTATMYDGGGGHWELTINLTSLNNGRLTVMSSEHQGPMEIIVNDGTLAIGDPNGNIYLDGDTLPSNSETTATGTSGSDMPVTIPYENVVINFKNNGEDILITFSQTNTTIYSMTLHQNENWKYDVVYVYTFDNPNYTITGVSKHDIPNHYIETNYIFTNPERHGDNDVSVPIYDLSIVEYTVDFTYDDLDFNNNEISLLRFGSRSDHNQIYVINNKIYWMNQEKPSSIESDEEYIGWIELNCPMLCEGTQITFKRYFLDGYIMTEWNDSNRTVKSEDWYSYVTNYNEPIFDYFNSYEGIDSVNVTVRRFKKVLPTLVSELEDANQYEKINNKSPSIITDTGSTSKYPTVKAVEDYTQHLLNTVTLSTNKQKVDAGESFIITANVKDNNGNPIANKSLTLMQKYDTYSNPDMSMTAWSHDVGFYVNDIIFRGDWSCSFKVNSTPDHTGLQLYISSEERILFSTLGATSTSEIEITCSDNTITINVDGTDYGTTYTQNSNGTKVGFFTHEDYSVSIKDFVVNSGMLYNDCGSQTTDSNGNCSWSFNDGLLKGLYSFYIDNVAIDVFVGLFVDVNEKIIYKSNMTSNDSNWTHSDNYTPTVTYSGSGCTVTGSGYGGSYILSDNIKIPRCFICEFDIISTTLANSESTHFVIGNIEIYQSNNNIKIGAKSKEKYTTTMPTTPIHIKVEYGLTSAIVYMNDLAVGSWATDYDIIGFETYKNRSITIKNLEIRTFDSQDWYDINIANFNSNETIIDDHIAAGSSVKFTYNKTDSTDCEGYIQLGYPMPIPYGNNNFISIGVIEDSGGGLNKLSILDNVSADKWFRDLPNKNSFDIEIRVPNFEHDFFNFDTATEWYIDIVVDGSAYRYNTTGYNATSSDNVYVFNRNNIYKVVQDTNSTITNLHYIRSTNSDIVSQNDNRLVTSNAVYEALKVFTNTIYPINSTYITTNPGQDPNDMFIGGWTIEDTFTADSNDYAIWRRVG